MNIQEREDRNDFIHSLPSGLWSWLVLICGSILEFYSSKEHKHDVDSEVTFFLDLLRNEENDISIFRERLKTFIESHGGKFRELTPFPKKFKPRDKKIINPKAEEIRHNLFFEEDTNTRIQLIDKLNKIPEEDDPQYKILTKNEEAEYCLHHAIYCCRLEYQRVELKSFFGLTKATLLYGYACGLLGLDIFGTHYKLNEDKTAQQYGGQAVKNKADSAKEQIIALWINRFSNPALTSKIKKFKTQFAKYIIQNPHLIIDENGQTLTKSNGEAWYTAENTISALLSDYEKILTNTA